jgi:hypothetical protein
MKENPSKLLNEIEYLADELGDVLCFKDAKKFGTDLNIKARRLSRKLHQNTTKLWLLFDPS